MAKMIEFYIPQSFRRVSRWLPENERGKLLEFSAVRKSARHDVDAHGGAPWGMNAR